MGGVGGQGHAPVALPPWKDSVPIVQEAGWASQPVWTGAENLALAGIRSPDRPARKLPVLFFERRFRHGLSLAAL